MPMAMVLLVSAFLVLAFVPAATSSPDWTDPVNISTQSEYDQYEPDLAVDSSGNSHVVWYGYDSGENHEHIYYATNTGGTWSDPLLLSTQSDYDQYYPRIALDSSGNAHVVWEGYDSGENYYAIWYSTNAGGTWSDPLLLSTQSDYDQYEPRIALDSGGNAHIVWYGYDSGENYEQIWYASNAGGTWSDPLLLSTQSTYDQWDPEFALDSAGNPHVVWYGYDSGENYEQIWYASNAGGTWSDPLLLSTQNNNDQYYPQIAVDSNDYAHVVWYGYNDADDDYYVYYTSNAGGTWSSPENISPDDDYPYYPVIAVDSQDNSHVIFHSHSDLSGGDCSCVYTTNSGGTWSSPVLLSDNNGQNGSYLMQLAIDALDNIYVAFDADDGMIYYNANMGSGWLWPDSMVISTQTDNSQYAPSMALDAAGNPHVVWEGYDDADDYEYIWYAEDITKCIVNAAVAGGGGTVDPAQQAVLIGDDATINITPDPGYRVKSVTDNGVPVTPTPDDSYTIYNVTVNHNVVVTFAKGDWYLAEGCTLDGFETWILVENPGDAPAKISMAFDTDQGEVVLPEMQNLTVPAHTRSSWNLANYIQTYDVATRVSSDSQVVCERAMYGNDRTWATESVGTQVPSDIWYLPEGCTGDGFESWILVQNPNDYAVSVNFALDTEIGLVQNARMQDLNMPAHTRASWNLANYHTSYDVATVLTSSGPVVAERSMYAPDHAWAHNSIGTSEPAYEWYLAEGCTVDMETWVLVQNPGNKPVEVDISYLTENGLVQGPQDEVIAPYTRRSFNAGDTVQSFNVSALVTATGGPVAVERSMYNPERTWGTCSIGTTTPAATWYLAEGCTDGMDTWILVANPGTEAATVSLVLDTGEGQQAPAGLQDLVIPAGSRASFHLNDFLTTYNVSTKVASDKPVVCERAMYGPDMVWADVSIGFAQ